jgi:dihydropteroate synthase
MQRKTAYADVVRDVRAEVEYRVAELIVRGLDPAKIIVDPGLGFAKETEHNWQLLGHLDALRSLGLPVLVGASRKGFVGSLLPRGADPVERDFASTIIAALAAQAGAWAVRVHDVKSTRAALDVSDAWRWGAND